MSITQHFQSCDSYYSHPCGIPALSQACPKMPCIYTSVTCMRFFIEMIISYACTHTCTHAHTCTHTHMHTHTHAHSHTCTHTRTHADTHTRAHTHTHTRTHTCTCAHAHTHTHTCAHTHAQQGSGDVCLAPQGTTVCLCRQEQEGDAMETLKPTEQ